LGRQQAANDAVGGRCTQTNPTSFFVGFIATNRRVRERAH
jgi:hypothetical protein